MANDYIAVCYAICKAEGIDTSKMSVSQVVDKAEDLRHKKEAKNRIRDSIQKIKTEDLTKDRKGSKITLPKQEYAQVCSIIRTKYTNHIPKTGSVFSENNYYRFRYDKENELIECSFKKPIENYVNLIKDWEE